ncbi:MAG: CBS domain-containing protein [Pirellulales bacterium]
MSFQLSLSTESVTTAYLESPLVVASDAAVGEVLQLLRTERTACVLVCDANTQDQGNSAGSVKKAESGKSGSIIGIFTERDALKWMATGQLLDLAVSEAMSQTPVTLTGDATVGQAIQKMAEGGYRHLPILATDGTPIGMAAVHGIVQYLVDHFPETIYNLPPTPNSVPSEREGA